MAASPYYVLSKEIEIGPLGTIVFLDTQTFHIDRVVGKVQSTHIDKVVELYFCANIKCLSQIH